MFHQNEALICWLQKFVLSCTTINGELHPKMVKKSNKITKIWSNSGRIFVDSKLVLLFGLTQGKIFESVLLKRKNIFPIQIDFFKKKFFLLHHTIKTLDIKIMHKNNPLKKCVIDK